jgi:hypothetical protein
MRTLLSDLGESTKGALLIYGDNQGALKLLRNPITSNRSKHIDVLHHFTRDRVARQEVAFKYIPTNEMIADIMTKALPEVKFVKHRSAMGVYGYA